MRMSNRCLMAALLCAAPGFLHAQTTSSDVLSILRSSLAAQCASSTVQDVSLSGTAERIVGADEQNITMQLKATASGSARTDLNLTVGTLTEIRQFDGNRITGSWSSGDGQIHTIAGHNLFTDGAWFFPLFIEQRLISDPNASVTFVGIEGTTAHFQATKIPPPNTPSAAVAQIAHWSQIDLYLDQATLLPVRLSFTTHPDDNALIDIPINVEFSEFQTISGATVPTHIKRSFNGTPQLDLVIQSVTLNTGLSGTAFQF